MVFEVMVDTRVSCRVGWKQSCVLVGVHQGALEGLSDRQGEALTQAATLDSLES